MPRKALIRSDYFPYHVVNRCNNKEWFHLPLETAWRITTSELYRISIVHEAEVHAFVLMSNHYHLLISTPGSDLGVIMSEFGSAITRTCNLISGRTGHLFGGPYRWSQIRTPNYFANATKYVYRNPIEAGISSCAEEYRFSTMQGLLGMAPLPFPLYYPRPDREISLLPTDTVDLLDWINEPFPSQIREAIRHGFRRKVFELPRDKKTGKTIELGYPTTQ